MTEQPDSTWADNPFRAWPDWEPPEYVGVFKKGEIFGFHCRNEEIEALQAAIDQEV